MSLAIAFGSRGSGAALAHYEPARNVINLTKMKGAGCLAHEWGHAFDNQIGRLCGGKSYFTESYCRRESNPRLYAAMSNVIRCMKERDMNDEECLDRLNAEIKSKMKLVRLYVKMIRDEVNKIDDIDDFKPQYMLDRLNYVEEDAINIDKSIEAIGELDAYWSKSKKHYNKSDVNTLIYAVNNLKALANNLNSYESTGKFTQRYSTQTKFYKDAKDLDKNRSRPYYSTTVEMFARAFESYVYDRIEMLGFKSEYLVHSVSSEIYEAMNMGSPYPSGDDRQMLYRAFNILLTEYRNSVFNGERFETGISVKYRNKGTDTYAEEKYNKKNVRKAVESGKIDHNSTAEEIQKTVTSMTKADNEVKSVDDIKNATDLRAFISYNVKDICKNKVSLKSLYEGLKRHGSQCFEDNVPIANRMGHTKAWGVKNGCLIINKGAPDDKKCEAIVEAVTELLAFPNMRDDNARMVREGVVFTLCKKYKLDVRTYCIGNEFDSLCKDKKALNQFLNIVIKTAVNIEKSLF